MGIPTESTSSYQVVTSELRKLGGCGPELNSCSQVGVELCLEDRWALTSEGWLDKKKAGQVNRCGDLRERTN